VRLSSFTRKGGVMPCGRVAYSYPVRSRAPSAMEPLGLNSPSPCCRAEVRGWPDPIFIAG
jgi:hypothetical protein